MACPFFTTMKLLMAAMLLIYSYFQLIQWRRNKAYVKQQEVKTTENTEASNNEELNSQETNQTASEPLKAE